MTARQLQRVASVGLDAVPWLLRDQARRHHSALDTQLGQLPVQNESCRTRLIASAQLLGRTKLLDELANRIFAVGDRAQAAYLAVWLGDCDSYRFGVDI